MKPICRAALAAVILIFASSLAWARTPPDTLVVADTIDDVVSLDPHEVGEVGGVLTANQIYQNLVTFDLDEPSRIVGVLARDWEVSPDGLTFTFTMNDDAVFASGNPVTAYDAEYSLRRIIKMNAPDGIGRNPFRASIITQFGITAQNADQNIVAKDERTLIVRIAEPYAPSFFLYCLSSTAGWIVDSKLVRGHEVDGDFGHGWLMADNSAGSGPFVLGEWKPKQHIVLERNENYWGEIPAMKRIIIRQVGESAAQRLLLEKGDIDIANKLSPDDHEALADNPQVGRVKGLSGTIYYMGLNVRHPLLANEKFRIALKYLVDYRGIVDTISRGTMETHQTMLPRGYLGAMDHNPYSYDLAKAKALLGEAGLEGEARLGMVVWNTPPHTDFAQALQASMAPAGIRLDLEVVDGKQWLTRYSNADFDIWLGLWGPDYPDPHSNAKAFAVNKEHAPDGSESLADRFGWNNGDMSRRAMDAVRERDPQKRQAIYEEIQRRHTATSPFVYMFQELRSVGVRANVKGVVLGTTYSDNRYWSVTKQ